MPVGGGELRTTDSLLFSTRGHRPGRAQRPGARPGPLNGIAPRPKRQSAGQSPTTPNPLPFRQRMTAEREGRRSHRSTQVRRRLEDAVADGTDHGKTLELETQCSKRRPRIAPHSPDPMTTGGLGTRPVAGCGAAGVSWAMPAGGEEPRTTRSPLFSTRGHRPGHAQRPGAGPALFEAEAHRPGPRASSRTRTASGRSSRTVGRLQRPGEAAHRPNHKRLLTLSRHRLHRHGPPAAPLLRHPRSAPELPLISP